jgi:hypothetical protein
MATDIGKKKITSYSTKIRKVEAKVLHATETAMSFFSRLFVNVPKGEV